MNTGGRNRFDWGTMKYTLAFHSSSIQEDGQFLYGGQPHGIILEMGGKTFYHAGDTALFGDMKLIAQMHSLDIAALPVGDVFTMGPEDASIAAQWLGAKTYIPMHYNTFAPIQQDAEAWTKQLEAQSLQGIALKPGESIQV